MFDESFVVLKMDSLLAEYLHSAHYAPGQIGPCS